MEPGPLCFVPRAMLCVYVCVSRCLLTTVDPDTGIMDKKEPLETLKRYNQAHGVWVPEEPRSTLLAMFINMGNNRNSIPTQSGSFREPWPLGSWYAQGSILPVPTGGLGRYFQTVVGVRWDRGSHKALWEMSLCEAKYPRGAGLRTEMVTRYSSYVYLFNIRAVENLVVFIFHGMEELQQRERQARQWGDPGIAMLSLSASFLRPGPQSVLFSASRY